MLTQFELGDRVQMRKKHACGGNEWVITRTGADIRIKCVVCGRSVMLDRLDFMRAAKKRTHVAASSPEPEGGKAEADETNAGSTAEDA